MREELENLGERGRSGENLLLVSARKEDRLILGESHQKEEGGKARRVATFYGEVWESLTAKR